MIHSKQALQRSASIITQSTRGFAGLFKKSKPTPKDLEKYDVIILGCNLGGILSRQFEKVTKNHFKIMVVFDRNTNEQLPLRGIYEQGKAAKTEYVLNLSFLLMLTLLTPMVLVLRRSSPKRTLLSLETEEESNMTT